MSTFAQDLHRQSWAEVDLAKIRRNYLRFEALFPKGTFLCPMIKADGYGHGAIEVAKTLEKAGARHLGVSLVEEGLQLRDAGVKSEILIFGIFAGTDSAEAIQDARLTPVVSEWQELEAMAELAPKILASQTAQRIHLKFNTGMNRLGFEVVDAPKLREWLGKNQAFELEGVMTHLLRSEDAGAPGGESESQLKLFAQALESFRGLNFRPHALNSSGCLNMTARIQCGSAEKKPLSDGSFWPVGGRPGLGIYGVAPENDENHEIGLEPALRWISHLVEVRKIPVGSRVSYGATWRAQRDSVIGVVPVGYADGFMRLLSNRGSVLCRGQRAPITGIVCMDLFMIDLTDIVSSTGTIERGEEIIMIGEQASQSSAGGAKGIILASELAQLAGTIPYEILTRISQRVPRIYKGG